MKKSFSVNIGGTIFQVDEDAYELLHSYLTQLHSAFKGVDGHEIVDDIEGRVCELLNDRTSRDNVVTLNDINAVISRLGSPTELNDGIDPSEVAGGASDAISGTVPPPYYSESQPVKRLFRDESNRVLGGVLSGLGEYYGWNVSLLRVLAIVLTFSTAVMPCFIAYVIAWCVIPAAKTPAQQLEMAGRPVNPITLSQQIMSNKSTESAMTQLGRTLGVCFLIFLAFICGSVFLGMIALFIYSVASIIGISFFSLPMSVINGELFLYSQSIPLFTLLLSAAVLIPTGFILWAIGITLFKFPRISGTTLIVWGIIEVILLIATIIAGSAVSVEYFMI